ncbi:hypothetical protein HOD38_01800 [archaeon]|jgi:ribosomal protein L44E|nr:hypothetical protein [archaeon]MBT4396978.1 hypothetical protein [archaeon]MBT4440969.1 hypothetical protein [archaeon]
MKHPKKIKRYCTKCKKHVEMAVTEAKQKTRSSVHTQSIGSKIRMRLRGLRRGFGNYNKYSKPAVSKFKRTGAKQTKKHVLVLRCSVCSRGHILNRGRAKKLELQ